MENVYILKRFLEVKGSNSLTHLQLTLFKVKDIERWWVKRYAENTVTEGVWKEALTSLVSKKNGRGLLEQAVKELGTEITQPDVPVGTGYTLEKFFKHIRARDLTTQQARLFGINKSSKGWKKRNKNKEVSEAVWKLLLDTCYSEKKEGTVKENQRLYLLKNEIGMYKVGISCDPFSRANTLANAAGIEVVVVAIWDTGSIAAQAVETDLHRRFKPLRMRGEWFDFGKDGFKRISSCLEDSGRFEVNLIYSAAGCVVL